MNRTKKNKFSNLAGYTPLKYVFSGNPLIASEPEVGNFQNWAKMKVKDSTNKKNIHKDFSDNFHNMTGPPRGGLVVGVF
jgi:hypothetical protein